METVIIAFEGRHVLWPRRENEQRTGGTSIETATLGFPILADRLRLYVYQAQPLMQGDVLYALFTFGDAWGDQYVATLGC